MTLSRESAEAIIGSITGLGAEHPMRLEIAWELGNNLIASVQTLDPDTYGEVGS